MWKGVQLHSLPVDIQLSEHHLLKRHNVGILIVKNKLVINVWTLTLYDLYPLIYMSALRPVSYCLEIKNFESSLTFPIKIILALLSMIAF